MKRDGTHLSITSGPQDAETVHPLKRLAQALGALVRPAIEAVASRPPADHLELARTRGELLDELKKPKAPVIPMSEYRKPCDDQ